MGSAVPTRIGRYQVLGLLGRGGMGVVYRAVDPLLDREVAIKVLPSHDDRSREHFTRNARVAATLRHPNIVTIYDVGEDQGQPFVAMEYVDGETLAQLIARRAPLSIPRRLEIVDQICDGLDYVHRAGVVHGDLKPANIAIAGDGTVKILDVGFSRLVSENTDAGMLVGTPRYLSPEQIEGRQIDARSDVFSVGLVVYETLAYTRAFPGDNIPDVLYRILRSEPPPLATVTPDVDPALDDAVQKAIRKDPSQRYQAMKELRADLARVRRRLASDTEEMPTTMPGAPAAAPSADPEIPTQQSRAAGRGRDEIARKRARHIEHYLEAALQHLDAGEFEQAMNESELAVMLDPDNGRANELLDRLRLAIEERQAHRTPPESPSPSPRRVDENVQFSVYRPPAMVPARWYTMLVFAHLATRRPDAPPDEPDPIDIVEQRAKVLLGSTAKRPITVDSLAGIPQEARLRVVPSVPGIEFDPPEHSFLWLHSVHQVEFNVRADAAMEGRTARGSVTVYLGVLEVARMTLAMPIESRVDEREQSISQVVNPYRRLFASYSHKDQAIVRQFENYAKGVGDRYVRDVLDLRAGEVWNTRLCELIESADVFQLFWSRNSMDSPFVRQEWEHALRIPKPDFVRPVYWEQPFPTREGLPPEGLARLHFAFVGGGPASDGAADPHQDAVVDRERQLARERAERERAAMREMRARERAEQERRAADARAREAAERARRATEDTSVGLPPLTSSPASPPASRTPPPVPMQSRREHPDAAPRSAAPSSSIVHVLLTLVAILFLAGVLMRFC